MFGTVDTIAEFQATVASGRTPECWTQLSTTRDHKALIMAVWPGMMGEMAGFLQEVAQLVGASEIDFPNANGTHLDLPFHEHSSMTLEEGRAVVRVGLNDQAVFTTKSTYYGPPGLVKDFDFGVVVFVPKNFLWESQQNVKVFAFRVLFATPGT